MRRLRILRAALFAAFLGCLSSALSRGAESTNATRTIVVLGDSLAAGSGVAPEESFPALLQKFIDERGMKFRVVNAGVPGDTSAGGLRRLDWLMRQRIDVLIVELGGNDGLRGILPEATRTNLQSIIDRTRARYPDVEVILAGMQMPPNMGEQYQKEFERIYPELAEKNNAHLIPFLLENVGGRPELNQPDRIHPTAEGQRIVAENVWKILAPVLEEMTAPPSEPGAGTASSPRREARPAPGD
ncbi:MAG TPA: arylesterase [Verrucomicrobia bacterium]|nr:arylesterase [Verrucomicrobiota bacterium]HOB32610.1 arylesterase [Verrucomicrobiota bacterium]HOP97582.1 arylesterase [Verrucomicrobiota bacterium]